MTSCPKCQFSNKIILEKKLTTKWKFIRDLTRLIDVMTLKYYHRDTRKHGGQLLDEDSLQMSITIIFLPDDYRPWLKKTIKTRYLLSYIFSFTLSFFVIIVTVPNGKKMSVMLFSFLLVFFSKYIAEKVSSATIQKEKRKIYKFEGSEAKACGGAGNPFSLPMRFTNKLYAHKRVNKKLYLWTFYIF